MDGATCTRDGLKLLRGSGRMPEGAFERRVLDHAEYGSRWRAASRGAKTRGSELTRVVRSGESAALRKLSRGAKRAAFGGGAERLDGMACEGTRAAAMAGPRGAADGAMRAERPAGDAALRMLGCAGARYGVGYTLECAAMSCTKRRSCTM
jgi:hypothetical protein